MRCRASPTSCAVAIFLPRPPSIGCCRRCSTCPRRAIATIGSCSTLTGRNCRRAVSRLRSQSCAPAASPRRRSARRSDLRRRQRRSRGRAQLSLAVVPARSRNRLLGSHRRSRGRLRHQPVDPVALALESSEHLAVELARARELDRHRVDEVAVDDHFVMEMRPGGQSRLAEIADHLALRDVHALGDAAAEAGHVVVGGHISVGVLDLDAPPVAASPTGP